MKKYCEILLITIFVPTLAFASFSDGFNSLLNKFFGEDETTITEKRVEISRDLPILETTTEFRREIQNEEEILNKIEEDLYESQEELSKIIGEKTTAEYQLQFLDNDISVSKQKLTELREQKEKWKKELEQVTRNKSQIETQSRVVKRGLENFMSKNFIQNESLDSGGDVSIFRWLFSRKPVSQILENRMQKRQFEDQQKNRLSQLNSFQKKLAADEYDTAKVFHRVEKLTQQEAEQAKLLNQLADAKANILARTELSQQELENRIYQARNDQAESTIILQNLRLGMQEIGSDDTSNEIEIETIEESKLSFPMKIPRKITAGFLDDDYKETLGQDHWGVDFRAPQGTEIFAPANGLIKKVAQNGYRYSYVIIDHGNDLYTVYGHISDVFVHEGDEVLTGDKIALTGGTPGMPGSGFFTTGPHLHMEVFDKGKQVDPLLYLE